MWCCFVYDDEANVVINICLSVICMVHCYKNNLIYYFHTQFIKFIATYFNVSFFTSTINKSPNSHQYLILVLCIVCIYTLI